MRILCCVALAFLVGCQTQPAVIDTTMPGTVAITLALFAGPGHPSPPVIDKTHARTQCPVGGWVTHGDGHRTRCPDCEPPWPAQQEELELIEEEPACQCLQCGCGDDCSCSGPECRCPECGKKTQFAPGEKPEVENEAFQRRKASGKAVVPGEPTENLAREVKARVQQGSRRCTDCQQGYRRWLGFRRWRGR